MKRLVCVFLVLVMLCACLPALAEVANHTWYSQFPLITDGSDVTVSVITTRNEANCLKDAKDMWFWKFSEAASGLKFQVEQVLASATKERKKLMFASDTLPDVIIGFDLTTAEIMTYGAAEKQLYALEDLLTEERTPYIYQWLNTYPTLKNAVTAADGHIYTLPAIINAKQTFGNNEKIFINNTWLQELNLEVPETLADFTNMLRAFKQAHPDCIPLGSAASKDNLYNAFSIIINAYGYLTDGGNDFGFGVAIRNGEAVIPAADPTFKEVLATLNEYYKEGLIDPNVFTMDNNALNADMAAWKLGVYPFAPYIAQASKEDFQQWVSVKPLTAEGFNDKQQWLSPNPYAIGGLVFSSKVDAKKMDLILRYFDYFYSDLGGMELWCGPLVGSEDTMGMLNGLTIKWSEDSQSYSTYYTDSNDLHAYASNLQLVYSEIAPANSSNAFGNRSHSLKYEKLDHTIPLLQYLTGTCGPDDVIPYTRSRNTGDGCFRLSMMDNIVPYEADGFPAFAYFTAEQVEEMNEINALLQPRVTSEVAKFITGARSLDEFDAFVGELEALGVRDLEAVYQGVWANVK